MTKKSDFGLPSFGPSENFNVKDYVVRYMRAKVGDVVSMMELELLETRGLEGKDILILSKNNYSFQHEYYIVVNYLEKKPKENKE